MNDLSVCLITKDEEKNLFRCLKSIRDVAGEIILVDTGSSDNTLNIARDFKCKIFQINWEDDFSAARNYALEQAQGQWILVIDADEELSKEAKVILKNLLSNKEAEGYFVQILNNLEQNQTLKHRAVRLFRNRPEYRYTGKIHEQIAPNIIQNDPNGLYNSALNLFHFGYQMGNPGEKQERNLKILNKELKEQPNNPFTLFNIATEYFILKKYEKAMENYEKALEYVLQGEPYTSTIIRNLAVTYLKLKEYEKCNKLIERGLKWYPDYTDLYYIKGNMQYRQNAFLKAYEAYEKCLELGEVEQYTSTLGVGSFLAMLELAKVLEVMGFYQKGLDIYIQALTYNDIKEKAIENIPPFVVYTGKENLLEEIEEFDLTGRDYLYLADNFAYWGDFSTALQILDFFVPNETIKFFRAHCLIHQGKFTPALEELKQIDFPPNPISFWSNVFLCACGLNDDELLIKSIEKLKDLIAPEEFQVFQHLINTSEQSILNTLMYLSQCWRLLKKFIDLNLHHWTKKVLDMTLPLKKFDTMLLTVTTMWNNGSPLTEEYLQKISDGEKISFLTVVEADLNLEQGNFSRAWELFNIAATLFSDDEFIRTGISLSALKEAAKLGEAALQRFSASELIDERTKLIQEELPSLEEKYRFLRLQRRKENEMLQYLLNSLHDS